MSCVSELMLSGDRSGTSSA